jgi:hypothetical protein
MPQNITGLTEAEQRSRALELAEKGRLKLVTNNRPLKP